MAMTEKEREQRKNQYEEGFRVMRGQMEYITYPEDASIRIWYSDVPWRYDPHMHSAIEIVLTLEGTVEYSVGEDNYQVRKGEILIVPQEQVHALNMGEESSRLLFLMEPDLLQMLPDMKSLMPSLRRVFYLHDGSEAHNRIRELLLKAWDIYKRREPLWNTMCHSYMLRVGVTLAQNYLSVLHAQPKQEPQGSMAPEVISAAMHYINNHVQEDLTLDDVAQFSGFSRFYFSRSFKQQTGFTFKEYVVRKRVQIAMGLLIETSLSMKEVARQSGFGSIAAFNRVFREQKQCTPSQYRTIYGKA